MNTTSKKTPVVGLLMSAAFIGAFIWKGVEPHHVLAMQTGFSDATLMQTYREPIPGPLDTTNESLGSIDETYMNPDAKLGPKIIKIPGIKITVETY